MKIDLKRAKHSKLTGRTLVENCLEGIHFKKGDKIELNFEGVELVSQSFLNELFKRIFISTGGLSIKFVNMLPSAGKVVEKEFDRVKNKVIPSL